MIYAATGATLFPEYGYTMGSVDPQAILSACEDDWKVVQIVAAQPQR
jgi:hypothetical protein